MTTCQTVSGLTNIAKSYRILVLPHLSCNVWKTTDQVNAVLNDNMSEEERAAAIDAISKQISAKAVQRN